MAKRGNLLSKFEQGVIQSLIEEKVKMIIKDDSPTAARLIADLNLNVSKDTVYRFLAKNGYKYDHFRAPLLSPLNKKNRLKWAKETLLKLTTKKLNLEQAEIKCIWDALDIEEIKKLVESFPSRLVEVLEAKGGNITKRSGVQIFNVTVFFLFFMTLYATIGVQFFGELQHHCVDNSIDVNNVKLPNLAVPDKHCSKDKMDTDCPDRMYCKKLNLTPKEYGYLGFSHIARSFFTVYESSSQEGWVFIMYITNDSVSKWKGYIFFMTLILFLAWLIRNVFVAVVIETFAEIRIHFQQMWGMRLDVPTTQNTHTPQYFMLYVPKSFGKIYSSIGLHITIILVIIINTITMSSLTFDPYDENSIKQEIINNNHYYAEILFTMIFNMEALFKIFCIGFKRYIENNSYKFEFVLCIGTTIHIIPIFYSTFFTYFQIVRPVRLLKASPLLEDFCWKIFGPPKKLGSLIMFTMCLLIITACISMQLFCSIKDYDQFSDFLRAFMVMFQIMTQKGWNEVMRMTMWHTGEELAPLTAIYFIMFHFFVNLVVVSLFVAIKSKYQHRTLQQDIPLRLKIYQHFKKKTKLISLNIPDFTPSIVRENFAKFFSTNDESVLKFKIQEYIENEYYHEKTARFEIKHKFSKYNLNKDEHNIKILDAYTNQFHLKNRPMRYNAAEHNERDNNESKGFSTTLNHKINLDIMRVRQKTKEVEEKRQRIEKDLRDNHPFFDCPLFIIGRDSKYRYYCKKIISKKYSTDLLFGFQKQLSWFTMLLGMISYFDWISVIITGVSCGIMMTETREIRLNNTNYVKYAEIIFVVWMSIELFIKICANGLYFTQHSVLSSPSGALHLIIYVTSFINVYWNPTSISFLSISFMLSVIRCIRPVRMILLLPPLRKVFYELSRGFKEITLVSILVVFLIFIFSIYALKMFGGRLARCNDISIYTQEKCVGIFPIPIHVTKIRLNAYLTEKKHTINDLPHVWVARVWMNPSNFDFDNIFHAMLALFEVLSLEGWLEIHATIMQQVGIVIIYFSASQPFLC
ncbi:CanIon [Intoshia linei]|uniref:CanIon n=1 Tax=Intoshia linei TaxID=1819745 RepID=A0A177BC14_9BILA|nr:CanIon [Intoshia linei]